ncbi:uncharacterized protein B0H18DRAFT_333478 [Fomitopsis serialis]|uniref:uncharacterized protein n=1 Tax=Fomitopsis serialis TaxID=139415 RepID=UPI00200824E3|nr:uncharacterized protein B0H18DRAFT_333478 [Neoantrodia serialis]KAH9926805.1 hypothetical protein B0H18DRAFT_333478 [Neoantrodia serialis]
MTTLPALDGWTAGVLWHGVRIRGWTTPRPKRRCIPPKLGLDTARPAPVSVLLNERPTPRFLFPRRPARTHARRNLTSHRSWRIASVAALPSLGDRPEFQSVEVAAMTTLPSADRVDHGLVRGCCYTRASPVFFGLGFPRCRRRVRRIRTHSDVDLSRNSRSTVADISQTYILDSSTPQHLCGGTVPDAADADNSAEFPLRYLLPPLPIEVYDRIPPEIFEVIIDFMARPMLLDIALVSRTWYPRAMSNFYHTVYIGDRTAFDLLVKQSRVSLRVKHWLATTHTVVVQRKSFPLTKPGQDHLPFMDSLPLVFADSLPALRVLKIHRALRPVMHSTFYLALRLHKQLVSLHLVDVQLSNVAQLQRIIRAFPRLEELVLSGVSFIQAHSVDVASQPLAATLATTRLKRLVLVCDPGIKPLALRSMVDWLTCPALCASLRDLSVQFRNLAHGDCGFTSGLIDRMLEGSGPSLTSFSQTHDKAPDLLRPCFVHNTALRHLELSVNVYFTGPWSNLSERTWLDPADELRVALSTVRSTQLESITIRLNITLYGCPETVEELDIPSKQLDSTSRSLHSAMIQPYFDMLKGVDVEMLVQYVLPWNRRKSMEKPARSAAEAVCSTFGQLFAPWSDRGIVNITKNLKRRR